MMVLLTIMMQSGLPMWPALKALSRCPHAQLTLVLPRPAENSLLCAALY
jgi:hypothetical protein